MSQRIIDLWSNLIRRILPGGDQANREREDGQNGDQNEQAAEDSEHDPLLGGPAAQDSDEVAMGMDEEEILE